MSDSDSFISEVSEEVRRDQLFAFFRRWGWAFGLAVLVIVGAAGFSEYRRSQTISAAERFGDSVISALDGAEPSDRIAALEAISTETPGAEMLLALLIAGQETEAGEVVAAAERLRAIADRTDMPERYRDLALLKAHILSPGDPAEARVMLDRLSQPGAPYRSLAIEQQAYLLIGEGDVEGGISLLEEAIGEAGAAPGLQARARELIVALQSGASLTDAPLPEPEAVLPDLPIGVPEVSETPDADVPAEEETGEDTGAETE